MSVGLQKFLRDTGIAIAGLLLTAAVDWLNNGGLAGTKYASLAAVLVIAIQAARRLLFPEATAIAFQSASAFGVTADAPPILAGLPKTGLPKTGTALDFDTPDFSPIVSANAARGFTIAADLDDDAFLQSCAVQVAAYTPGGKAKQFDLVTIGLILLRIFLANVDVEALLEKAKQFILGWLARWKLRSAIKAAMLAEGDKWKPGIDEVDGFETWLTKADAGVIRRVRMIADSRRK